MSENLSNAIGPALFIFLLCAGAGSCNYLSAAGLARQTEARAALIAVEKCSRQEARP